MVSLMCDPNYINYRVTQLYLPPQPTLFYLYVALD